MEKEIPHIGKLIQKKMKEEGRKSTWLADIMCCDKSNISRMYHSKFIPTEQLIKACICLETDLFVLYSEYVREQIHIQQKNNKHNPTNNI